MKGKAKKKLYDRKKEAKRKGMGFNILFENPFDESEEIDWHHIDNEYVIAIPRDIHQLYAGYNEHRRLCNEVLIQIYQSLKKI